MASVHPRKNRAGEITSYQVKWRDGGTRAGAQQSESFEDETAAGVFKEAVDDAGQHWPPGWVKGRGYIAAETAAEDAYRFRVYARRVIENRTGIEERYRAACQKELEKWIYPTFGECDVRSVEHFSGDTIKAWVRVLERTRVTRGRMPDGSPKARPMSPKTIRNLHGLLSSILNEAVRAEPPLRSRNPCELTNLPRIDDSGASDDDEDIEFLTPQEVHALRSCLTLRQDQLMVDVKYGSGLRWGELTALAPTCILEVSGAKPRVRVKRAWKRDETGAYYLGTPKTKKSRRTLRISTSVVEALLELEKGLSSAESLYFTGDKGQRLHYSTFHDRWKRAVARAKKAGLLAQHKNPTPHDLRHSHAAALISAGHPLTYVQRRLGHESIKTTSDVYGHLLPEADDDAMATIEAAMAGNRPRLRAVNAAAG
ncbi:tyrosine-type recombinase/integrase [Streptomyces sp. NPDC101132]|uniref:tyrosine-type recombinase/integrase n=1 Tax=Streptomyces sp. NPDC101132 TaxID=3366110 RepID=UPI00380B9B09